MLTGDAAARSGAAAAAASDIIAGLVGVVPFAVLIGVVAVEVGIDRAIGFASTPIIAGGSAQIAVLGAIGGGAVAAVALGLVVNVRGLIYSATLAPSLAAQPTWFRWLAPYFLVDQMFALAAARVDAEPAWFRTYYLTAAGLLYSVFIACVGIGMVLGPVIGPGSPLTLAIPILFGSFLVRGIKDRAGLVTALVAGGVAAVGSALPVGLGLIAAIVAGSWVGAAYEARRDA